jgi:hypothetical protein
VRIWSSPPEFDSYPGTRWDVSSGERGLLAGDAATHGVELKAGVLGSFDGASNRLTDKGRHLDSTLLHLENNSARCGQFRLGLRIRR